MARVRLNVKFKGILPGHSFGVVPCDRHSEDPSANEKLFAFAVTERSAPRVFEYTLDADGIEGLSNLLRAEEVIAVVQGHRAQFEIASTVSVNVKGMTRDTKLVLGEG